MDWWKASGYPFRYPHSGSPRYPLRCPPNNPAPVQRGPPASQRYPPPPSAVYSPPRRPHPPSPGYPLPRPPPGYRPHPPPSGYRPQPPSGYRPHPPSPSPGYPPSPGYRPQPPSGYRPQPPSGYRPHPPSPSPGYRPQPPSGYPLPRPPSPGYHHLPRHQPRYPHGNSLQYPQGNSLQHPQGNSLQHPQGNSLRHPQGNSLRYPQGNSLQHPQGNSLQHPQGNSLQHPQGNLLRYPPKLRHGYPPKHPYFILTSRAGPRLLSITRSDHGFGFTLRHFIVYPPELSELLGEHVGEAASSITSLDPLDTIFVKHVRHGSSAHLAGLRTGDRVVSVNGESVGSCTYQEVVAIIQRSPPTLQLMVVPSEEDLLQQVFGDTAHNPESNLDIRIPNPSPLPIHGPMRHQPLNLTDSGLTVASAQYPPSLSPSAWSSQSSLSSHISAMSTGPHPPAVMMAHPPFQRPHQPPIMPVHPQHPQANIHATQSPVAPPRTGGRKHSLNAGGTRTTQPTSAPGNRKQSLPISNDRQQAVHTIQNTLNAVPHYVPSVTGNNSPIPTSTNMSEPSNKSVFGVYEPILDRALVRGNVRDNRRLERDPNGLKYEVVQSRVVESKVNAGNKKKSVEQAPPRSHVDRKSSVGGEAEPKRVRVQSLSPPRLRVDHPNFRSLSVHTRPDGSKIIRDGAIHGSHQSLKSTKPEAFTHSGNRLNRARRSCTEPITWSSEHYQVNDKTQEVIERIKKNVETKEEFLRRPNQPIWLPASKAPVVHRDYHVSPQKFPKPLWPPPGAQTPPSPGAITKALSFIVAPRQDHPQLRRVQSEVEHRNIPSHATGRSGSLPSEGAAENSGDDKDSIDKENRYCDDSGSSTPRSLVGNSIPKPYTGNMNDANIQRFGKSFIRTLSRIQENIPIPELGSSSSLSSQGRQGSRKDDTSQSCTPYGTPTGSQTSLNSPSVRSVPLAWVGDNERIKQLQIVSRRAKQFESNLVEKEPTGKSAFHRFELSRLSQRSKMPVAQRKQEIENKDGDQLPSDDAVQPSSTLNSSNAPLVSMNRTTPVGGPHIHCEPPGTYGGLHNRNVASFRPQSDSDVLDRERSNSVCSQASMSSLWSTQSMDETGAARSKTVGRQNSYLSALRSPLAVATPSASSGAATGGEVVGVVTSAATPTVSTTSAPTTTTSASTTTPTNATSMVSRRSKNPYDDEGERLVRRVSYLKATSGERMYSDSDLDSDIDDVPVERGEGVELVRVVGGVVATPITPAGPLCVGDLPSPASLHSAVVRQGTFNVKLTIVDGKKAADRSWKTVWAVVQGRALIFYKDRQHALQTPLGVEEQISLRGSEVEVASDYTKRRNVLRLATPGGSQLLLQPETAPEMLAWLTTLQDNCTIQEGESGIKTPMNNNVSPQSSNKAMRKLTSSLRTRSPTGQSPSTKSRKPTNIESNSSPKSKTWRGHLVRPFMKKMQGGSPAVTPTTPLPEGATIGVCLEDCPQSIENEYVPLLVALCINVIETRGLQTQGIYRIPGNKAAVTHLTEMINKGPKSIDYSDPRWSDVNVISSMLKQFYQKLPDPLFTCDLYPLFIEASKTEDPNQRMVELKRLVHDLPDHHYETLRFLMMHLSLIVSQCEFNKMDVRNLAIVFGPTLVRSGDDNMVTMVTDMSHQCRIVETLVSQALWFFNEDDSEDSGPPVTDSSDIHSPAGESLGLPSFELHETPPSSQAMLLHNINKVEGNIKVDLKKDIVSSIISAANRKVHKVKYKKNLEDKVVEESKYNNDKEGGFEERDIDKEAELRKNRLLAKQMESLVELPDPKPMSERKISNMSLMSVQSHVSGVSNVSQNSIGGDRTSGSEHSKPGLPEEEEGRLFCVVKSGDGVGASTTSLSSSTSTLTSSMPTSQPSSQLAPECLSLLGDEVAIRSYAGLSASTQERIRRFEMETRAMLHRDLTKHRRETERRDLERRRLEELWQRAKQDMESEDILDQLADNPTEVVRKISDYSWRMQGLSESGVGGERGSLASHGSGSSPQAALISAALSHHPLSNTSLTPTTNVSTQILNGPEMGMARCSSLDSLRDGSQAPPDDGSDLLSAITATFEEKMRSLQESPLGLLTASASDESISSHSLESDQPHDQVARVKTECRLYRDPSLHRRRTNNRNNSATSCVSSTPVSSTVTTAISKVEDAGLSNKYAEEENKLTSEDSKREAKVKRSDSLTKSEKTENNMKEKTEKRARELKRTDTQESLNEKRPKEMKRSDQEARSRDLPRKSETKENSTGSTKRSSEVRNRKHNVKELKERFEQNTGLQSNASPMKPNNLNNKVNKSGMRRTGRGPIKRRHTVGGTKDLAKWAWLQSGEATKNNPRATRLSAWERLQPLVADERLNTDRSLEAWLAHERIRTSSPDLSRPQQLVLPCDVDDKENLHRRLSVQEATLNPLYPVLESHV